MKKKSKEKKKPVAKVERKVVKKEEPITPIAPTEVTVAVVEPVVEKAPDVAPTPTTTVKILGDP